MQQNESYVDLVVNVEELAARVALVKKRFAKQKLSVKVAHSHELENVYSRCREFKHCLEDLEDAEEFQREADYAAAETAWNKSMDAVDALLHVLQ